MERCFPTIHIQDEGESVSVDWRDDEAARLARLWNKDRLTASQIAQQVGKSRNAVLCKARRMDLDKRIQGIKPAWRNQHMSGEPPTLAYVPGLPANEKYRMRTA